MSEIAGHRLDVTQFDPAGSGVEAKAPTLTHATMPLAAILAELVELQTQRRFCVTSQSRCDRSIEALLARSMGYSSTMSEKERAAIFKKVSAIRKMVEKGADQPEGDDRIAPVRSLLPLIMLSAQSREQWDAHRDRTEERMRELARLLPVFPWASAVVGFGDLPLSVIVAEAGDLSNYATVAKLWKRLGLAVIGSERQRKKSDKDEAAAHGYSPRRRATIYGDVQTPLFFAKSKNQYGAVYAARREHTAVTHPEWTKAHSDNDARRYIVKRLLRDLWRAWREASLLLPSSRPMPPAHYLQEAAD